MHRWQLKANNKTFFLHITFHCTLSSVQPTYPKFIVVKKYTFP